MRISRLDLLSILYLYLQLPTQQPYLNITKVPELSMFKARVITLSIPPSLALLQCSHLSRWRHLGPQHRCLKVILAALLSLFLYSQYVIKSNLTLSFESTPSL